MATVRSILENLDINEVNQVYFGRTGCACGCGGEYHAGEKMIKTAITKILKKLDKGEGFDCEILTFKSNEGVIDWNNGRRAIRIYFKDKVKLGL